MGQETPRGWRGPRTFRLSDLIDGLETETVIGDLAVPVTGVTYNSRAVRPGSVFFCVRGLVTDGHRFIPEAAAHGAAAIVVQGQSGLEAARAVFGDRDAKPRPGQVGPAAAAPATPVLVVVNDTRLAMGRAAANFYGHPSRQLRVIGVTGTNGKTTTTHLVRELLNASGRPCGLIGTVHNVVGGKTLPAGRTTPEAFDLQNLAREMVEAGDTHLTMEVASHALSLDRVAGFEFDVAVFTNLTQDHLDFHGDFESYFQAKARLFTGLGTSYLGRPKTGPKVAVINFDDPLAPRLAGLTRAPVVGFSTRAATATGDGAGTAPGLRAVDITLGTARSTFRVEAKAGLGVGLAGIPAFAAPVVLAMTGAYNVSNALAALAVALIEGVPPEAALAALAGVHGAPGRFELVNAGQEFTAVVDYAHTPDGLENVLQAARALGPRRLITVFGCGGDRDRTKRPLMGEVAARWSDFCVVTSDNPRSEDPLAIIGDILPGLAQAGRHTERDYVIEPDRRKAIHQAVRLAGPGDLVMVAGKGHETYQIFADRTVHFDDREVIRDAVADRRADGGDGDGR